MKPYWVETQNGARIAIVPRPRGEDWLEDELLAIKQAGVDVLVSMLTAPEVSELGLRREAELCTKTGLQFVSFLIEDRSTPESTQRFTDLTSELQKHLAAGRSVATHCRASIGRASLVLAGVLCRSGQDARSAFEAIATARGTHVPDTEEQARWIERFAEQQAGGAHA